MLVLRIGGETGWDELNVGERGYPRSNSISSIGIWPRFSSVLMGGGQDIIALIRRESVSFRS